MPPTKAATTVAQTTTTTITTTITTITITMEALALVSTVAGVLHSMPTLYRLEVSQMVYKTQKLGKLRQLRE